MPLPPMKLPQALEEALKEVLLPSSRRIGSGLLALVEGVLNAQRKSIEEILLDGVHGEIDASERRQTAINRLHEIASDPNVEHQRILARAATRYVPVSNFIVPALPIAGRIFRESEFDDPGSPIWDMWVQLLARSCDRSRAGQAHPSFPWIISQLSSDEAKLLDALAPLRARANLQEQIPSISSSEIGIIFPENVPFYLGHLGSLGLLMLPMGFEPSNCVVFVDDSRSYMLTDFGQSFMSAVSQRDGSTVRKQTSKD